MGWDSINFECVGSLNAEVATCLVNNNLNDSTEFWETPANGTFPIELIFNIPPSKIGFIELLAHEFKLPSKVVIFVTNRDRWEPIGFFEFKGSFKPQSHYQREMKHVYLPLTDHFYTCFKLKFYSPRKNTSNIDRQVAIYRLRVWGVLQNDGVITLQPNDKPMTFEDLATDVEDEEHSDSTIANVMVNRSSINLKMLKDSIRELESIGALLEYEEKLKISCILTNNFTSDSYISQKDVLDLDKPFIHKPGEESVISATGDKFCPSGDRRIERDLSSYLGYEKTVISHKDAAQPYLFSIVEVDPDAIPHELSDVSTSLDDLVGQMNDVIDELSDSNVNYTLDDATSDYTNKTTHVNNISYIPVATNNKRAKGIKREFSIELGCSDPSTNANSPFVTYSQLENEISPVTNDEMNSAVNAVDNATLLNAKVDNNLTGESEIEGKMGAVSRQKSYNYNVKTCSTEVYSPVDAKPQMLFTRETMDTALDLDNYTQIYGNNSDKYSSYNVCKGETNNMVNDSRFMVYNSVPCQIMPSAFAFIDQPFTDPIKPISADLPAKSADGLCNDLKASEIDGQGNVIKRGSDVQRFIGPYSIGTELSTNDYVDNYNNKNYLEGIREVTCEASDISTDSNMEIEADLLQSSNHSRHSVKSHETKSLKSHTDEMASDGYNEYVKSILLTPASSTRILVKDTTGVAADGAPEVYPEEREHLVHLEERAANSNSYANQPKPAKSADTFNDFIRSMIESPTSNISSCDELENPELQSRHSDYSNSSFSSDCIIDARDRHHEMDYYFTPKRNINYDKANQARLEYLTMHPEMAQSMQFSGENDLKPGAENNHYVSAFTPGIMDSKCIEHQQQLQQKFQLQYGYTEEDQCSALNTSSRPSNQLASFVDYNSVAHTPLSLHAQTPGMRSHRQTHYRDVDYPQPKIHKLNPSNNFNSPIPRNDSGRVTGKAYCNYAEDDDCNSYEGHRAPTPRNVHTPRSHTHQTPHSNGAHNIRDSPALNNDNYGRDDRTRKNAEMVYTPSNRIHNYNMASSNVVVDKYEKLYSNDAIRSPLSERLDYIKMGNHKNKFAGSPNEEMLISNVFGREMQQSVYSIRRGNRFMAIDNLIGAFKGHERNTVAHKALGLVVARSIADSSFEIAERALHALDELEYIYTLSRGFYQPVIQALVSRIGTIPTTLSDKCEDKIRKLSYSGMFNDLIEQYLNA